jgi:serine/threonine protein phosphatase PrpC
MAAEVVRGARTLPLPLWHVATASVRGSAHGTDIPNQDAVATASIDVAGPHQAYVAAVADGHGGSRYVRSDRGARLAVRLTVDRLMAATFTSPLTAPEDILRDQLPKLVEEWRRAVHDDVHQDPFTPEERSRAGAGLDAQPAIAYGATLLVALISEGDVGLAQLGDGDLAVRTIDGRCLRPVPGDGRLVGGETTSLCLPTAGADFRFASLDREEAVEIVLLATDGYGNSFAEEEWWPDVLNDIAGFVDARGHRDLAERLPDWLSESALVGGDDVTVAVLARTGHDTTSPAEGLVGEVKDEAPTVLGPIPGETGKPEPPAIAQDSISLRSSGLRSGALPDSAPRSRTPRIWIGGAAVLVFALAVVLGVVFLGGRPAAHAPSEQRSRSVSTHAGVPVTVASTIATPPPVTPGTPGTNTNSRSDPGSSSGRTGQLPSQGPVKQDPAGG